MHVALLLLCTNALASDTGRPQDTSLHDTSGTDTAGSASSADTGIPVPPPASYRRPIAYWPFDDSTATDHANMFHGELLGPTTTPGVRSDGLRFDGIDDFVDFGDSFDAFTGGPNQTFSIAMWVRPQPSGAQVLLAKHSDTGCDPDERGRQWSLTLNGQGAVQFGMWGLNTNAHHFVATEATLVPQVWTHVVVVYDGRALTKAERVQVTIDGVPANTIVESHGAILDMSDGPARVGLGARLDSTGATCDTDHRFHGELDEVAVWGVNLMPEEIDALYLRTSEGHSLMAEEDHREVVMVLDTSCSMSWGSPLTGEAAVSTVVEGFGQAIVSLERPGDLLGGVGFADRAHLWRPLTVVSDDPQSILDDWTGAEFQDICCAGCTNTGDAILQASGMLYATPNEGAFKAIVLVTDGNPTCGSGTAGFLSVTEAADLAGIHIYSIAYGSGINDVLMLQGVQGLGSYHKAPDSTGLANLFNDVLGVEP